MVGLQLPKISHKTNFGKISLKFDKKKVFSLNVDHCLKPRGYPKKINENLTNSDIILKNIIISEVSL